MIMHTNAIMTWVTLQGMLLMFLLAHKFANLRSYLEIFSTNFHQVFKYGNIMSNKI